MKMTVLLSSVLACVASLSMAQVAISYDVSTCQNRRPYQEDRFRYAESYIGQFFGIYDGHGGDKTSSYLQRSLHGWIFRPLIKVDYDFEDDFKIAFRVCEDHALKNYDDGSTAVVAFIDNKDMLHCAWTGDSRAVLESNGTVEFATQDHKPERDDEQLRIKNADGDIYFDGVWRVNGLAVSRSIGDRKLKNMGQGQIIAVPEYAQIHLNRDNHFMIIASDGLWDVISNEEAVSMVQEALKKTGNNLKGVAQVLQNEAIKRKSGDNITVCVVQFDWSSYRCRAKEAIA